MSVNQDHQSTTGERWIHDLRNVVNVLGSSITLSRRLIEKGRHDEARGVLHESEKALAQCFILLKQGVPDGHADAMQAARRVEAAQLNGAANHLSS